MILDAKPLRLKLLGYPEVYLAEERLKLPTQKLQAILYFLALKGQASREELAELLWESAARHRLRPELHRLKNLAGAESWLSLDEIASVRLDTDLANFEQHVRAERYKDALELHPEKVYFLQGFGVEDAPQFMDWLSIERERVRGLFCEALVGRAEELSNSNQFSEALHLARLLIELDPLDESAYRLAMRLEYARGHIQAALKQFETCRRVLAEEFGMEPLEETLTLVREIEKGKALPVFAITEQKRLPPQLLRPPSLIAREVEWARMEAAFSAGQAIFISGSAGVGKTRLMLDFASSKGDVVMAEGRIGDKNIPFSSVARLFKSYIETFPNRPLEPWVSRELNKSFSHDYDSRANHSRNETSDLLNAATAFFNHAAEHMSVFPTDNLHYFDTLSADISNYAATELHKRTVLSAKKQCAINTFRTDEMPPEFHPMLEHFVSHGLGIHIELEPLNIEAVKALILSLELFSSDELMSRLHKPTSGNPQFLVETLKSLYVSGQLDTIPEKIALPEKIAYTLSKRLDGLSSVALRIAKAVATLELSLSIERLADVLELNAFDIAEGIAELEAVQVFANNQFVHDLLQETAKKKTPAAVQRHLHKRAATLLEQEKPIASRIAHHYLAADEREKALPWRLIAIEEAVSSGFLSQAYEWLEELLFEAPEESRTYQKALLLKGEILLQQNITGAIACFQESLELSKYIHSDIELKALEGLAQCARRNRNFELASSYLQEALAFPLESGKKASLHHLQAVTLAFMGNLSEAETAFIKAIQEDPECFQYQFGFATFRWHQGRIRENADLLLSLLRRHPDKAKTTLIYHNLGTSFWALGETKEALSWMQKSLGIWQSSDNTQNEAMTLLGLGSIQLSFAHYTSALSSFEKAEQLFQNMGALSRAADARSRMGYTYCLCGQLTRALAYCQEALDVLREQSEPFLLSYALSFLATSQLKARNLTDAQTCISEAIQVAEFSQHPLALLISLPIEASLAFATGNPVKAKQLNQRILDIAKTTAIQESLARALLFEASLNSEKSEAITLASQALELAEQHGWAHLAFEAESFLLQQGLGERYLKQRLMWLAELQKHAPSGSSFEYL